jgi:hypothetical protein
VRVNSDKQTLILAGEAAPRRDVASSSANSNGHSDGPRLTIVATRADETMLLARRDFAHNSSAATENSTSLLLAPMPSHAKPSRTGYFSMMRSASFNAANEYARTQDFSAHGHRTAIIDTYA